MKRMVKKIILLLCIFCNIHAQSQSFNLVWSDEFDSTGAPDPTKWSNELGYVRNDELQYYTNSTDNARQFEGNLEITIRKEKTEGNKYGVPATFDYTSASLITLRKIDWIYGKIEGRFKMPKGKGLWACFWTLGANYEQVWWPKSGEIDIFEHINSENLIHGTAHWADSSGQHVGNGHDSPTIDVTQWHNYSIQWTPGRIKWFVDAIQFHEVNIMDGINSTAEFHKPHYILINYPIGGSWPGPPDANTVIPSTLYCDYVRVFEYVPEGSQTGNQFINCGGDFIGAFSADKWYSTGASFSDTKPIDRSGVNNPAPVSLYQSNRHGNMDYTISGLIADSSYQIRLHFAENNYSSSNARLFNVKINDSLKLSNFDIFASAGKKANKAVIKEFIAVADSAGKIAVKFISVKDFAQINGIEVTPLNKGVLVSSIFLPETDSLTNLRKTLTLTATIAPANATNQNILWASSNSAVATVSSTGVVKAVKNGNAYITATALDGTNKSDTCFINVYLAITTGVKIPAKIEAENFTEMNGIQTSACPEGGLFVGWTDKGDWMKYNIYVPTTDTYNIDFRVASPNDKVSFQIKSNDMLISTMAVPNTGSWDSYKTINLNSIKLSAGYQSFQIYVTTAGWNLNWFSIKEGAAGGNEIEKISSNKILSIYPNPAKANLSIDLKIFQEKELVDVSILSLSGMMLYHTTSHGNKTLMIELSTFAKPGVYFVKVRSENELITRKFVIE